MTGWRAVLMWVCVFAPVAALQVARRWLARGAFAAGQAVMELSWWIDPCDVPGAVARAWEPLITGCPWCGAVGAGAGNEWAEWVDEEGDRT